MIAQSGCYAIRNVVNGHLYVGSSKDLPLRKAQHWTSCRAGLHHSKYLQRAWDRHGEHNFVWEVLEQTADYDPKRNLTEQTYSNEFRLMLLEREQHYLDRLNPQYNMLRVAGSSLGAKFVCKEETKRKISAARKGKVNSPDAIERMRQKKIGLKQTAATIEKRVSKLRGRKHTTESISRMIEAQNRPEVKEHQRKVQSGKKMLPEAAQKRLETLRLSGKKRPPQSAEANAKRSASLKRTYADGTRPRLRHSEETRAKMRESAIRRHRKEVES